MSDQWIKVDVFYQGSPLYLKLMAGLGPAGPLAWINLLCSAKQSSRDGSVKFTSQDEALDKLGLLGEDLGRPADEWLEAFWRLLGQQKQTRRTSRGRVVNVRCTHWGRWQEDRARDNEAEKKRRQRARKEGDIEGTGRGRVPGHVPPESESDSESFLEDPPKPPLGGNGQNPVIEQRNGNGQAHVVAGAAADVKSAMPAKPPIVKQAKR